MVNWWNSCCMVLVNEEGVLSGSVNKVLRQRVRKFVLVEYNSSNHGLAFRERIGELANRIHENQVLDIMVKLQNLHAHFVRRKRRGHKKKNPYCTTQLYSQWPKPGDGSCQKTSSRTDSHHTYSFEGTGLAVFHRRLYLR